MRLWAMWFSGVVFGWSTAYFVLSHQYYFVRRPTIDAMRERESA